MQEVPSLKVRHVNKFWGVPNRTSSHET